MNLVRMITGGWAADGESLARREFYRGKLVGYHGLVNACLYGDQCEGHACYCAHPDGRRKCSRVGWGRKPEADDEATYGPCPFRANPHWKGSMDATFAELQRLGMTHDFDETTEEA